MLFLILLALSVKVFAQTEIDPSLVDSGTKKIRGPHLIYEPSLPTSLEHKVLITIGGTSSRPADLADIQKEAVRLGYKVLAIDYPNSVISTTCRRGKDIRCFDHFREEVVKGTDVSAIVDVDRANSIEYRIESLFRYLAQKNVGWTLDWSKITLLGYSQGSGHAAYLSKLHKVARVILIAGPQDSFENFRAEWLSKPGATANENYFALLHKNDIFRSSLQLKSFKALTGDNDPITSGKVKITDLKVKDPHRQLPGAIFRSQWLPFLE